MESLKCFRSKISSSTATNDSSRYSAVPQYIKDIKLNTPRPTCVYIHFSMVNGGRNNTLGKIITLTTRFLPRNDQIYV